MIDPTMETFITQRLRGEFDCIASDAIRVRALSLSRCLPSAESSSWWNRARATAAILLCDQHNPAGAALRGGSIRTMEFSQNDVHIDIEVEPVRSHATVRAVIRGQLESVAKCEGTPVVFVDAAGDSAATTTLDDLGFFSVILPSGKYDIAFALPAGAIFAAGVLIQ